MINTKEYILDLSMPEKVSLFNELYSELSGYGTDGDTELAHVNTFEVKLLKSVGGSGTINEITELQQFGGGGQPAPPANQSVTQTTEFPPELRPFISDILGEAQAEFNREKEEGFLPFPGPQIASFTPEQQAAFETGRGQFTGLAGTPLAAGETYARPALAATALGTSEIGAQDIGRRMDPFIQNVVDIAKREATRDEEAAVQGRAAQAVGAGSFGGTRQALVESEAERNLGERLGDIQARGLSTAFQNAQQSAEAQRQRELAGGRQFAAIGDAAGQRARSDISGLAGIGETQQQRGQQALDIARQEFGQEQVFPAQTLGKYQSIVRGFPYQMGFTEQRQQSVPTPSLAQTLGGGLQGAAGLYGMFGGFGGGAGPGATGGRVGNIVGRAEGGGVAYNIGKGIESGLPTLTTELEKRKALEERKRDLEEAETNSLQQHLDELNKKKQKKLYQERSELEYRSIGGLVSLQGGGVPTAPTTGGVPQVPAGAQKMVPHLMKMYESNPQFKNKIDQDIQRMVPQVQGVNLGAGGAQTNLGMAGAPPYTGRSGGGLVSLKPGGSLSDLDTSMLEEAQTYYDEKVSPLMASYETEAAKRPTREEILKESREYAAAERERAKEDKMQSFYASLIASGAGMLTADPQKGAVAAFGSGVQQGLPVAAAGMADYRDTMKGISDQERKEILTARNYDLENVISDMTVARSGLTDKIAIGELDVKIQEASNELKQNQIALGVGQADLPNTSDLEKRMATIWYGNEARAKLPQHAGEFAKIVSEAQAEALQVIEDDLGGIFPGDVRYNEIFERLMQQKLRAIHRVPYNQRKGITKTDQTNTQTDTQSNTSANDVAKTVVSNWAFGY